jgi:hypothetical protein
VEVGCSTSPPLISRSSIPPQPPNFLLLRRPPKPKPNLENLLKPLLHPRLLKPRCKHVNRRHGQKLALFDRHSTERTNKIIVSGEGGRGGKVDAPCGEIELGGEIEPDFTGCFVGVCVVSKESDPAKKRKKCFLGGGYR